MTVRTKGCCMARILIVEDDEAQRALVEMMLAREGLGYEAAANGLKALGLLARESDFDLILTDIRMPGMDGQDFVQALKRLYPHIPVLAMTVHSGSAWIRQALANGAIGYLVKPFSASELADAINNALERHGQPQK